MGMKKWLRETSALCGYNRSDDKKVNEPEKEEKDDELRDHYSPVNALTMGLNLSCNHPMFTSQGAHSEPDAPAQMLENSSQYHAAISVITTCSSGISSLPTVTHSSGQVCSQNNGSTLDMLEAHSLEPMGATACPCPSVPSHLNSERLPLNSGNTPSSSQSSHSVLCRVHDLVESIPLPISSQPLNCNAMADSSEGQTQATTSTNNSWCHPDLNFYGLNSWNSNPIYGDNLGAARLHNAGDSSEGAGASTSGCGHWCSTCRVKVQVEVECVSNLPRPSSSNKKGLRNMINSKILRHIIKAPTKDASSVPKKKKTTLNLPFRGMPCQNRCEVDHHGSSSSSLGCCVQPNSRNAEPSDPNRDFALIPHVDSSTFNADRCPITDIEETARRERAREMAEGIDPPPDFVPLFNAHTNSLNFGSVLEIKDLLDRSFRLGLSGPSGSSAILLRDKVLQSLGHLVNEVPHPIHTQVDYIHCLVPDLLDITNCAFYWGKMDRYEAERLLESRPEGTFLLRDSAQEEHLFSVSFRRYERSLHARIEQWNHTFSFDSHDPVVFASDTVCGLIERYKDPSCCMFFEPLLTRPLSRTFPFPLQHLCRATICSRVSYNDISKLATPKKLMSYLKEYHYKQRVRVRHLD